MLEKALQRLERGDSSAFDEIYELTRRTVFAVAYSYTREPAAAEDVMQETYVKIMRFIGSYHQNSNARAWIIQIAKNASLDYIKSQNREAHENVDQIYDVGANDKDNTEASELVALIEKNLDGKSSKIVILHLIGDMTFYEIASVTKQNAATVRWKYGKALKKLQIVLRENGYE